MDWKEFFDTLPAWDEEDRVTKLQRLVKIKATHLPVRGRKSSETDWFNFLITQVVVKGRAFSAITGDKADELITCLCPFAEECLADLFVIGAGRVRVTPANKPYLFSQLPRYSWVMTMEIVAVDPAYKAIDIRQLYAQVLNKPKQSWNTEKTL